jgi:prepilin-type N-terminal cleavage/methylation domain-containing protein
LQRDNERRSDESNCKKLDGGGIFNLSTVAAAKDGACVATGMDVRSMFFLRRRRGRRGFTLVEVIVVLVILAILAAIAIPALTGYIDKAEDKKLIAEARDVVVAYRTILNEEYADGTLGVGLPDDNTWGNFLWYGDAINTVWPTTSPMKRFKLDRLSTFATIGKHTADTPNDWLLYMQKVAELRGAPIPSSWSEPGIWREVCLYAPRSSSYTINTAPSFTGEYYRGDGTIDIVTYGIKGLAEEYATHDEFLNAMTGTGITSDPNTGYHVYHVSA